MERYEKTDSDEAKHPHKRQLQQRIVSELFTWKINEWLAGVRSSMGED